MARAQSPPPNEDEANMGCDRISISQAESLQLLEVSSRVKSLKVNLVGITSSQGGDNRALAAASLYGVSAQKVLAQKRALISRT